MAANPELLTVIQAIREVALTNKATAEAILATTNQLISTIDSDKKFVPIDEAAKSLSISTEMLKDRCRDGRLQHGKHFINTSDGDRPNYLICVSAVLEYLQIPPEKRRLPKRR